MEARLKKQIVDCTNGFAPLGTRVRTKRSISIAVTPHTYLPEGELAQGWFPNLLRAFRRLASELEQEIKIPRSFASIGVGPGLDAIAAVELLNVDTLWLVDLHQDVVDLATYNVLGNCPGIEAPRVHGLVSDLCTGLLARDIRVDLLYENLPNLPASDITLSVDAMTASFFDSGKLAETPPAYSAYRLGLHYLFLAQASDALANDGSVVCCIGGRVKIQIVRSMFTQLGYVPHVLSFGLVRQFESEKVLAGYVTAESENGIEFTFYPYKEACEVVAKLRRAGADIDTVIEHPLLRRMAIGSTEARDLERQGHAIGHLGIVWRGVPTVECASSAGAV